MRAACGIHCGDLKAALETYDLMSRSLSEHIDPLQPLRWSSSMSYRYINTYIYRIYRDLCQEVLHARLSHALQRGHAAAADVLLLPAEDAGR